MRVDKDAANLDKFFRRRMDRICEYISTVG